MMSVVMENPLAMPARAKLGEGRAKVNPGFLLFRSAPMR
jgi:hypothetical protein